MPHTHMTAQRCTSNPAFQAHDIAVLYGLSDRNRRLHLFCRSARRRFTEATESLIYACDQISDLIDRDTVFHEITADDLDDQTRIDFLSTSSSGHNILQLEAASIIAQPTSGLPCNFVCLVRFAENPPGSAVLRCAGALWLGGLLGELKQPQAQLFDQLGVHCLCQQGLAAVRQGTP